MGQTPAPDGSYWFGLTHGQEFATGSFLWHTDGKALTWSDEVYRMYGFEPGEVLPTIELLLAHKHPDDLPHIKATLAQVAEDGGRFTVYHRILNAGGRTRYAVTAGEAGTGPGGRRQISGYTFDITGLRRTDTEIAAREAVLQAREHMAVIEQAKGALCALHGIGGDEAYAMLAGMSRRQNIKVHDLAAALLRSFEGHPGAQSRGGH